MATIRKKIHYISNESWSSNFSYLKTIYFHCSFFSSSLSYGLFVIYGGGKNKKRDNLNSEECFDCNEVLIIKDIMKLLQVT